MVLLVGQCKMLGGSATRSFCLWFLKITISQKLFDEARYYFTPLYIQDIGPRAFPPPLPPHHQDSLITHLGILAPDFCLLPDYRWIRANLTQRATADVSLERCFLLYGCVRKGEGGKSFELPCSVDVLWLADAEIRVPNQRGAICTLYYLPLSAHSQRSGSQSHLSDEWIHVKDIGKHMLLLLSQFTFVGLHVYQQKTVCVRFYSRVTAVFLCTSATSLAVFSFGQTLMLCPDWISGSEPPVVLDPGRS